MSTYYMFYIGYIDNKTKKVHALGPYDDKGRLKYIFYKSRSFISELYREFTHVKVEDIDDSIKENFTYKTTDYQSSNETTVSILYLLPIDQLPSSNYIKRGYFLVEDVKEYLQDEYEFDGFYEKVDPIVYSEMVKHEAMFGKPKPEKDEEGNDIPVYSASDYMYFSYEDYGSQEYEVHRIKLAYNSLYDEYDYKDQDITPVVLLCID